MRPVLCLLLLCLAGSCAAQRRTVDLQPFLFTERTAGGYRWEQVAHIRHRRLFGNSVVCAGNTVYSFGGFDTQRAIREMSRLADGRLEQDSLHYPGAGFFHNICFTQDSVLFIGGGKDSSASRYAFNDLWRYDLRSRQWQRLADLPFYYQAPPCVLPGDTDVVVLVSRLEGADFRITRPVFYRYDMAADRWLALSIDPPAEALLYPAACRCGENIYVLFTYEGNFGHGSRAWYRYDLAAQRWTRLADFPGPERSFPLLFCDNRYCYAGGGLGNRISNCRDLFRYDPRKNSWEQIRDLPEGVRHAVAWTNNGAHYIGFGLTDKGSGIHIWRLK